MERESNRCNGLEHVPTCSTWPPPWLREGDEPARKPSAAAERKPTDPPPDVSPKDLPPDLYELWEERAAIMEYDGGLPTKQAEAAALADVLGQADQAADKGNTDAANARRKPENAAAEEPSAIVQTTLFAVDGYAGPNGRELRR